MARIYTIKLRPLILSILLSLGVGLLSGFLVGNSSEIYVNLVKPPLSPPAAVFPVVWIILYILMGISAYLIYVADAPKKEKKEALRLYKLQLAMNFLWSFIFFKFNLYFLAFIWLMLLFVAVLIMIKKFNMIDETASALMVPYALWLAFAGYLNLMIILLN